MLACAWNRMLRCLKMLSVWSPTVLQPVDLACFEFMRKDCVQHNFSPEIVWKFLFIYFTWIISTIICSLSTWNSIDHSKLSTLLYFATRYNSCCSLFESRWQKERLCVSECCGRAFPLSLVCVSASIVVSYLCASVCVTVTVDCVSVSEKRSESDTMLGQHERCKCVHVICMFISVRNYIEQSCVPYLSACKERKRV